MTPYDPRYLKGIELFNAEEFFEAHEVWEDVWRECNTEEKKFYQGLIQAAAAFVKVQRNSRRGALSLYETSRAYLAAFAPTHRGLHIPRFLEAFDDAMRPIHEQSPEEPLQAPKAYPRIHLDS